MTAPLSMAVASVLSEAASLVFRHPPAISQADAAFSAATDLTMKVRMFWRPVRRLLRRLGLLSRPTHFLPGLDLCVAA